MSTARTASSFGGRGGGIKRVFESASDGVIDSREPALGRWSTPWSLRRGFKGVSIVVENESRGTEAEALCSRNCGGELAGATGLKHESQIAIVQQPNKLTR